MMTAFHTYLTRRFDRKIDCVQHQLTEATRLGFFRNGSRLAGQDLQVRKDLDAILVLNQHASTKRDIRVMNWQLQRFLMKHYKVFDRIDSERNIYAMFDTMFGVTR